MQAKKLYRVTFPNGFILARCGEEQYFNFIDVTSVDQREPWEFNFTEKEIKAIDERYWIFKKEVAQ